jgi:predicted Zn-dependent protease
VLLALLGFGARRAYLRWDQHRLLKLGFQSLDAGNYPQGENFAQQVISIDPDNVLARRLAAIAAEKQGDSSAVAKWARVVALQPGAVDEALIWARVALQFKQPTVAEKALQTVPEAKRSSAKYQYLAGQVAVGRNDLAGAREFFLEAMKLEPENHSYRLALARTELQHNGPGDRAQAREILRTLETDKELRREAVRSLLEEAMREQDWVRAVTMGEKLQSYDEAILADRLLYLEVLHRAGDPRFLAYLTSLQSDLMRRQDAVEMAELVARLNTIGEASAALSWIQDLSEGIRAQVPLQIAAADAHITLEHWKELRQLVEDKNWQKYDFLRQIYLARALREQGDDLGYRDAWARTLRLSGFDFTALARLGATLLKWGWEREAVDVYLRLASDRTNIEWALQTLAKHYVTTGDSAGFYSISLRLARERPDDVRAQNNVAQLSLLLNKHVEEAKKLAHELYLKEPKNASCVSTYAFALYLNRDFSKALDVMNSLTPAQLSDPAVAAYYGVILAAVGDRQRAKEFLSRGAEAELLPQEKELVAKAQLSLADR